ncbi:MAG: hypothetical protein ACRD4O_12670, partial [Bryobacteraceae bacterium]
IVESIERTVRRYLAAGEMPAALQNFLHRQRPRVHESLSGPLIHPNEDVLAGAKRVVLGLDRSALCIQ